MKSLKTVFLAAFVCVSFVAMAQEEQVIKKHNFGFGVSSVLSGSTSNYLKAPVGDFPGYFGNVDKNLDLNISARYEYAFNRSLYLGTGLTYRYNRTELTLYYGESNFGETTFNMHDLEIPLYLDYKLPIMFNTNAFFGAGFSALINLSYDDDIIEKDTFSPYLLLRTGFEVSGSHRLQFLFQYRIALTNAYSYKLALPMPYDTDYRVNSFDVGVNFFF